MTSLIERIRRADPRAVARAISYVENGAEDVADLMSRLTEHSGNAIVVGITGAPGVGKSTTASALVTAMRKQDKRVGVLAVDPSSPFTKGALLGDRIRMREHADDARVFIRSMATRGHLGGVALATAQAVRVLDAAGCDIVFVETVGVGQSEIDVARFADSTIVVLAPGFGDGVQAAKAGILEIGDIFVVNKADRDGADAVVRDLRETVRMVEREPGDWRQPIISTVAPESSGIDDLVQALETHHAWAHSTHEWGRRRVRRVRDEIEATSLLELRGRLADVEGEYGLDALTQTVISGDLDPYTAARKIISALRCQN